MVNTSEPPLFGFNRLPLQGNPLDKKEGRPLLFPAQSQKG